MGNDISSPGSKKASNSRKTKGSLVLKGKRKAGTLGYRLIDSLECRPNQSPIRTLVLETELVMLPMNWILTTSCCSIVILFLFSLDKKGNAQVAEENPVKHVRMEQSSSTTPNITPVSAAAAAAANNQIPPSPKPKPNDDDSKRRIVSMEQSVHTFAGTSSTRRDRSDPVMITDALSDVRVK